MPRIRTLKPEHRQHRKVGPLDDRTYRLWVGMILEADDEGRLVCDSEQLRVQIFGYHPKIHKELVEGSLAILAERGLLRLYGQNGIRYADFPSWKDHQKINHFTPSKLPSCEDSVSTPGGLSEDSVSTPGGLPPERKGKERKEPPRSPPVGGLPSEHSEPQWLALLNRLAERSFRPVEENLRPIRARIRAGYTLADAEVVIRHKVAQWRGDPKMAEYLRPVTLFGTKFDSYLAAAKAEAHEEEDD